MKKLISSKCSVCVLIACTTALTAFSQQTIVREQKEVIKTYPYSDPNPVPPMVVNNKIGRFYPYFMFDGYTTSGKDTAWNMVELENDFIKVKILPDVGGKVHGAIEKSTGKEFVYLNKVLKFRSIGIRGPWVSGGIEHNFGLDIGHAPWTASPVDYAIVKEKDGSMSCVVGGLDLASRTQWRVKIRLPHDKAYFETSATLYNPTPLHHSYLSWENAAYKVADDLRFYFPGTHHIGHDGSASPWPIDEKGRDLSWYKNNNFGASKSYHVVGSSRNWYGGYYHDEKFGWGHWAPYTDAPGKKLWIWALSRSGGIWKDLLTDTDPQYLEAQSGVKFNQADIISGYHSPYKQLFLRPGYLDTKSEYWFPVKGTGGMSDAGRSGTLSVIGEQQQATIHVQALESITDTVRVIAEGKQVYAERLNLKPMEVFTKKVQLPSGGEYEVIVGNRKLYYHSGGKSDLVNRPVVTRDESKPGDPYRLFLFAEDQYSMRKYDDAQKAYEESVKLDPSNVIVHTRLAELQYRKFHYDKAIQHLLTALSINTYEPAANYLYGVILKSKGDLTGAAEAFSVAVRGLDFRSDAYAQLAGISLLQGDYEEAAQLASSALQYNAYNFSALQLKAAAYRKSGNAKEASLVLDNILELDPLNHFARFEKYLLSNQEADLQRFKKGITNEFPDESYLEIAVDYMRNGMKKEASTVLMLIPRNVMASYWLAWLHKDESPAQSKEWLSKAGAASSAFVFPFREEAIPVLEWAAKQDASWKHKYYLGLIYWNRGREDKAAELFQQIGGTSDYAAFYIARGLMVEKSNPSQAAADFKRAWELEPSAWRNWHYYQQHLQQTNNFETSLNLAKDAYAKFPGNAAIGTNYAKALNIAGSFADALKVLKALQVLPAEHTDEGHTLYEEALLGQAVASIKAKKYKDALKQIDASRLWPENLGSGMPYEPDTRLQNYLAAHCFQKLKRPAEAAGMYDSIAHYTLQHFAHQNKVLNNYLGIKVLREKGRSAELDTWMKTWKNQLDSLRSWNVLAPRSGATDWLLAQYQQDQQQAEKIAQSLASDRIHLWQRFFFEALKLD